MGADRWKKPLPGTYVDEDHTLRWYVVEIRNMDGEAMLEWATTQPKFCYSGMGI